MIVVDARYIQDHFPGIGRYTYNLIDALARVAPQEKFAALHNPALRNTRYDLAHLGRYSNLKMIETDVPTFSLREQFRGSSFKFQVSGFRFQVSSPVETLHATSLQDWKPQLFHSPYFVKPYFTPIPSVVTLFDLIPLRFPKDLPTSRARLLFRLTVWLAARTAARVIAPSQATREDLVHMLRVPSNKIRVVPLAADARFAPQPESEIIRVRDQYALPSNYILYVGINKPHKNLATLLRAVGRLGNRAALVIAGAWDERYERLYEVDGVDVTWIHAIADMDLPALYSGAAAFVLPSLYEGFGLPALEAMACGAPVIVANAGSLPEVVGEAGLLFEPRDSEALAGLLTRLLDDRACREDLAHKSLARAAQFSWEHTAEQTLSVYREVM